MPLALSASASSWRWVVEAGCVVIVRNAPSEAVRAKTLRQLRQVEGVAFAENSRANMEYTFARGYVTMSAIEKAFWLDPSNGNHYFLGAQYPESAFESKATLEDVPVRAYSNSTSKTLLKLYPRRPP